MEIDRKSIANQWFGSNPKSQPQAAGSGGRGSRLEINRKSMVWVKTKIPTPSRWVPDGGTRERRGFCSLFLFFRSALRSLALPNRFAIDYPCLRPYNCFTTASPSLHAGQSPAVPPCLPPLVRLPRTVLNGEPVALGSICLWFSRPNPSRWIRGAGESIGNRSQINCKSMVRVKTKIPNPSRWIPD